MIGFLATFALGGLATAAWPLYLHLRKERRRRIQVVPSLKLFQWRNRPARRRKVQDLLILVSRVGILAALCLLVSQPFLESARDLPLPYLASPEDPNLVLGVVIDDSLTAFHGQEPAERFEKSRAWLLKEIDLLPETVQVSLAATSYPRPTGLLAKEDARALLEGMRVIPKQGNAAEALARLAELLRPRGGALIVAAPLERSLWSFGEAGGRPGPIPRLFFLDTSKWRRDSYLRRVVRQGGAAEGVSWICELAGGEESLAGKELVVKDRSGSPVARRRISIHEALQKSVPFDGSKLGGEAWEATLDDGSASRHPWLRYYFARGKRAASGSGRLVFFLEDGEEAALATRILETMVKSLRPGISRSFFSSSQVPAREIPDAWAAVFVGSGPAAPRVSEWLERQIETGIQVLCFPAGRTPDPDRGKDRGSWLRLPSWGDPVLLLKKDSSPLRANLSKVPDPHRFDSLLLGELEDLEIGVLREPLFASGARPILVTASGRTLLSLVKPNGKTSIWAFGAPVTMEDGGFSYHPVFPLLLDWVLFPSREEGEGSAGGALVGESVDLASWFGVEVPRGKLIAPSGGAVDLGGVSGTGWAPISEAGIFELRSEGASLCAAANHPRAAEGGLLYRKGWQEASGVQETVWLSEDESISQEELKGSPLPPLGKSSRRYDLSSMSAILLAGFLVSELVLLGRCWLRRRS